MVFYGVDACLRCFLWCLIFCCSVSDIRYDILYKYIVFFSTAAVFIDPLFN